MGNVERVFDVISATFAFLAAIAWFVSARVNYPELTYQPAKENPFYISLRKAAHWNAAAATCAGVSAACQAIAMLI